MGYKIPPPPPGKKEKTPKQKAAAAAAYAKAKAKNPYYQTQAFLDQWHQRIDPIFEAYTGHRASKLEAVRVLAEGWSDYHLQLVLSGRKSFINSPVWRTNAPAYKAVYQQMFGANVKAPTKLLRYAIIHNLGGEGFAQTLRQSHNYLKSNEFKQGAASLENVYREIFGSPDPNAAYTIKQATLAGWNPDQFAKYLRTQPQYKMSNEFRTNASKLTQAFGGAQTLTYEQALSPTGPWGGVPNDKRLPPPPRTPNQPNQQPNGAP